jgi:hypothetical protein
MAHTDSAAEAATKAIQAARARDEKIVEAKATADASGYDESNDNDVKSNKASNHNVGGDDGREDDPNVIARDAPEGGQFEAVAVDFSPGNAAAKSKENSSPSIALVILAGLTGGSKEGYVLDLVNTANKVGIDCFVMLGRGLGGTPNLSNAAFHGARTSDLRETARVIRRSLPPQTKLFAGKQIDSLTYLSGAGLHHFCAFVAPMVRFCVCVLLLVIVSLYYTMHVSRYLNGWDHHHQCCRTGRSDRSG